MTSLSRALIGFFGSTLVAIPVPTLGVTHAPKPLPAPPTLPLIRIEVARDHVLVLEDVVLRRGDWTGGDLDMFVAFGAPGVPRAVDTRLGSATDDDGSFETPFEAVSVERAFRRAPNVRLLLGSPGMAGAVVHLRASAFARATEMSRVARIRIRSLLDTPVPDARTGREIVIRLGSHEGEPDALGSIEIASKDPTWLRGAEAHLCGPEADPYPLAIHVGGPVSTGPSHALEGLAPVAPVLSVRHATDDLCVRFWTTAP